jgi:DeoR family transcriptional regulator of aga operon
MYRSIAERHKYILNRLSQTGKVNVIDLSIELEVSAVTIRKDLKLLEEKNLLFRSHGIAINQNPYVTDRHVIEKEKIRSEQKTQIAIMAASLVEEKDYIILASGTTINEMARQLKNHKHVTVISASLIASQLLTANPDIDVIQLGGEVRKSSSSVVGPAAEKLFESYNCNKLFLGVDGIDPEYGLTTTNGMEASLNKCMIMAAQKIIVLADSSKLNRKGFGKICSIEQVDILITDDAADNNTIKILEDKGIEVIIVEDK